MDARAERTCIGCGARREKRALVRLVLDAGGCITVDRAGTAVGRGAWLCGAGCLRAALKRKAFGRAFRGKAVPFETAALEAALGGAGLQREEIGLDAAPRSEVARKG
jgi:predicted RNA-binding protein YlxR (DUF448 family)